MVPSLRPLPQCAQIAALGHMLRKYLIQTDNMLLLPEDVPALPRLAGAPEGRFSAPKKLQNVMAITDFLAPFWQFHHN